MAEGIGRGDAVFLPAFTYTATAEVPLVLGATPVFVDVDPRTFQIDPAHLAQRIADVRRAGKLRPRALIGVDLFGQPADWPALRDIAAREEPVHARRPARRASAHAARPAAGRAADATATSFFPSKPLGAYGDGGALFTESDDRAALYRSLRTHGEGTTRYEVLRTGMNGRLDSMQAAVLLAKLTVFRRGAGGARAHRPHTTTQRLGNAVVTPARVPDSTSAWAIYAILLPDAAQRATSAGGAEGGRRADRDLLPASAASPAGVSRRTMTARRCRFPRIWRQRILALPIHPDLSEADVAHVCDCLLAAVS